VFDTLPALYHCLRAVPHADEKLSIKGALSGAGCQGVASEMFLENVHAKSQRKIFLNPFFVFFASLWFNLFRVSFETLWGLHSKIPTKTVLQVDINKRRCQKCAKIV